MPADREKLRKPPIASLMAKGGREGVADLGDDRNAHPKNFEVCVVAIEGKRVEADINSVERLKVGVAAFVSQYFKAIRRYSVSCESLMDTAISPGPKDQGEAGTGDLEKNI